MYTRILSFITICGVVHHYLKNWIRHLWDCLPQTMAQRLFYRCCESANSTLPYVCIYASRTSEVVFLFSLSPARHSLTSDCIRIPGVQRDRRFYEMHPLSSSIREMGGWFGTLVLKYICVTRGKEIAQDCTLSLSFLSLSHTHTHTHTQITVVELTASIAPHPFCWSTSAAASAHFSVLVSVCVCMCVWSCTHSWGYGFGPGGKRWIKGEGRQKKNSEERVDPLSWMSSEKQACRVKKIYIYILGNIFNETIAHLASVESRTSHLPCRHIVWPPVTILIPLFKCSTN